MAEFIVPIKHTMCIILAFFSPVVLLTLDCCTFADQRPHTTRGTDDANASNSSYYSTRELRDEMLKELGGRTQEVQDYFDQLPSEMFKEDSDTLKFMHYYEKKGMKNIDPNQVYNITPQVRLPPGPLVTIEVNNSYVPKYRITPSEVCI